MFRVILALIGAIFVGQSALAQTQSDVDLQRRAMERRAVEAVIWGMPAVNYDLMLQEMLNKTTGKVGEVIYWGKPLDWHNQTLTPNPDTLYFMTFFDTKDGPVVLDFPPASEEGSLNANIVNIWQMPLEDVGLLGVDKGAGGKFVLVPPGHKEPLPDGYTPLQLDTDSGYALIRSNLASHGDADVARSVAYGKTLKVYPLAQAANPPATVFTDVKDVLFDSTIRYDSSFFTHLNRIVQTEPWLDRDRVMIDQLRTIGIEKGKPYDPDSTVKAVMETAVKEAHKLFEAKYDAGLPPFFSATSRWTAPVFPELAKATSVGFSEPSAYPVDARGLTYTYGYIGIKRLGAGQFYLISIRDKAGESFDGSKTYRLTVPPNPPVEQYWSVTAYDRETHALIKNMPRASRASNAADVLKNADGSVDIYFGPNALAGKEMNWVPTDPAREFELMFRAYGPKKEFFAKEWVLPDVEKVDGARIGSAARPSAESYAFEGGFPMPAAAQRARDDADLQRAITAYRFWYPTVSVEGIFNGNREKGIEDNTTLAIMSASPRQVAFTANADTPYGAGTLDLSQGPMVIEIPPGPFIGLINDHNQGWVLDMGIPGPDAGKGGKHLVVPPGYDGEIPSGYFVGHSPSFKNLIAIRSMPTDGTIETALNALKQIKIYPLSTAAAPKLMEFRDITQEGMDGTSLRWEDNIQFWEKLHKVMQEEPAVEKFFPMYGLLEELGIEKGKPFAPDARLKSILEQAAKLGRDQMLVSAFDSARPDRVNWPDSKWEWVSLTPGSAQFETPNGIDLESRDRWFAQAIVTSPAMFRRTAGAGSLYWLSARDGSGAYLDGGKTYRLTVPQPVPGKLFWSVTVYDAETRSQIQTDQNKAALRSMFELKDDANNASVDLFFAPRQPAGTGNRWIKTSPGKGWFAYFRIYGPEQAAFDKSWKPGDFEEIAHTMVDSAAEGASSGESK